MSRFLQIHWLASYPAALLNRDDAGLAKRIPFGGVTRGRISSQCLKRHWRLAGADSLEAAQANPWALQNIGVETSIRSKEVVEQRIRPRLESLETASPEKLDALCTALIETVYGTKAADPKKRQALLLGETEIEYLAGKAAEAMQAADDKAAVDTLKTSLKDEKKNIKALVGGGGLQAALFGRMVTSDPAANTDAAIHVAHALTVHALERELDFMTVVDDLKRREDGDDSGAAGIFDMELASGLYYGYVVVDLPLLVANLSADSNIAGKVLEHVVHLIAEVSPGAKKGSTAPYAYAQWMMVELGDRQPRTLANAFYEPLSARDASVSDATKRLGDHLKTLDEAYGTHETRQQMSVDATLPDVSRINLNELAEWAASGVAS